MDRKSLKLFVLINTILFFFCCCSHKEKKTIESIIVDTVEKYDNIDFSKYNKLYLMVRERRLLRDAIGIESVTADTTNWWRSFVIKSGRRLSILNDQPFDTIYKRYISDDSIKSLARSFIKLDLDYLKVDGNYIFLSPRPFSFESAFMLKINDSEFVDNNKNIRIEGDGSFTHYKKNWYISDFYIDKYNIKIKN